MSKKERSRSLSYTAVTRTMKISKETPGLILCISHIIPVRQNLQTLLRMTKKEAQLLNPGMEVSCNGKSIYIPGDQQHSQPVPAVLTIFPTEGKAEEGKISIKQWEKRHFDSVLFLCKQIHY